LKAPFAGLLGGLACCILSSTAIGEAPSFKILKLDGNAVQWRGTVAKKMVTYALVERDTTFERARNCRKMTRLDGLMSASKIAPETVRAEITAAFAMWETVANIRFREAASPEQADILIGAQLEPVGWAFADVFYDASSREQVKPISRSLICLNPERGWKIGFDGDLQRYDIRYTLTHEIGHALGFTHDDADHYGAMQSQLGAGVKLENTGFDAHPTPRIGRQPARVRACRRAGQLRRCLPPAARGKPPRSGSP